MAPRETFGRLGSRARNFWQRVTEGLALEELWAQFASEARASYGLYSQDVDWEAVHRASRWRRPFHVARALFWALLMKLSPARRVLLLVAVALLVLSGIQVRYGQSFQIRVGEYGGLAALTLFLLLALELADRVTMKRDLEIAREIQHWLVPDAPPVVPGVDIAFATQPANTVAGDYYDAFFRPPADGISGSVPGARRLLVVVADVAGKSVPAALLMATFQASLRALAALPTSLAELVDGLNRYSCAHSLEGRRFTTAFFAELDRATGALAYINAGHNAPLLRRAAGDFERLEAGGLPLGIEPRAGYDSACVTLAPGDLLVVFTDGVVEAVNGDGEEFGERRLETHFRVAGAGSTAVPGPSADDALAGLMAAVDGFVGAARQHDDITCLILRVV